MHDVLVQQTSSSTLPAAIVASGFGNAEIKAALGIDRKRLIRMATVSYCTPAPWMARRVADMFGGTVEEFFPRLAEGRMRGGNEEGYQR